MRHFDYRLNAETAPALGLIVLATDERIEADFRRLLPDRVRLFVSRVASGLDVTPETLRAMEAHIPASAALLPRCAAYDAIGYGCTSGTAQIGRRRIAALVRQGAPARAVTEPVSALIAACADLGLSRLAFLSPYVAQVSGRLRRVLRDSGIATPLFGSFAEAEEARVARIAPGSIHDAALALAGDAVAAGAVDGIFISCTNLDTLDVIAPLETATGLPVLSSNLVLAWHMWRLAGAGGPSLRGPGRLIAGRDG